MVSISKALSLTTFRANMSRLINDIINENTAISVGTDDKAVVVLPMDDYNKMRKAYENQIENEYLLHDSESVRIIKENMAQMGSGKSFTMEEFDEVSRKLMEESDG